MSTPNTTGSKTFMVVVHKTTAYEVTVTADSYADARAAAEKAVKTGKAKTLTSTYAFPITSETYR